MTHTEIFYTPVIHPLSSMHREKPKGIFQIFRINRGPFMRHWLGM